MQPKPLLSARGWTVLVVDYRSEADLQYNLAGADLVISMVTGNDQLLMIDAALSAGVERFVPAEFAGISEKRPQALDRGQRLARNRLRSHVEEGMSYTLISCGIFYERFSPNGLASVNMGNVLGANGEGDYLMNIRSMRAQIPHDSSQRPAMICMTSIEDTARFIVAALDVPKWPNELRVCGQRLNVSDVVRVAETLRGMCTMLFTATLLKLFRFSIRKSRPHGRVPSISAVISKRLIKSKCKDPSAKPYSNRHRSVRFHRPQLEQDGQLDPHTVCRMA